MSHEQARDYLQTAADGMLGARARAELERHLDVCAQCRAYAAELAQLETGLSRSLQARWLAPRNHQSVVRHSTARVQARVRRRRWVSQIFNTTQAVAWAGLVIALVVVVAWIFMTVTPQLATTPRISPTPPPTSMPTAKIETIIEAVTPPPDEEPDQERQLVICLGSEPDTLYIHKSSMLAADRIFDAIYDGPIDSNAFGYQPVILEKLPSLSDGDANINTVQVQIGDLVIDDAGDPVALEEGTSLRPAGCYSSDCAVLFDSTPVEMEQMVVTFTLKAEIRWSDAEPLTAHDSVYSFELERDPDTPSNKMLIQHTARYEALDDYTTVWTGLPGYRDSEYFTHFWTPLPEHAWSALTALELNVAPESTHTPLGWGAYAIQEWIPGDHISLAKNEHYWRASEGLPKFNSLIYRFVGENASANVAALLSGECDVLDQTTQLDSQSEMLLELQAVGKLNAAFSTGTVWEHADFGIKPVELYERPDFFGDVRMRRAIAYCMDRQSVAETVLFGQSQVLNTFVPSEHPLFYADARQYHHDPKTGSTLLERMGWIDDDKEPETPRVAQGVEGIPDGTALAFNYWTTSASQRQAVAEILQASLAECGIQVSLEYWSPGDLFADGPDGPLFGRRFDLGQFAWLSGVRPPCDLYLCSQIPTAESKWAGSNNSGFCNAAYDAACEAALQSLPGTPEYEQNHHEAQRIFAEQLPAVPLYMRLKVAATRPDMQGFVMDPTAKSELWNIEALDYEK